MTLVHGAPDALPMQFPNGQGDTDALQVAYESVYTWDYSVQRADLRNLYEKSKDAMWNARTYLKWDTNVDPEAPTVPDQFCPIYGTDLWNKLTPVEIRKLRRLSTAYLLSNFLHGEQGALLATSQIVSAVPSIDAKFYAATQVADEARHVECYERYLREKLELTLPISPHLRTLLDEILSESRWDMKYLGMQLMVEGLALASFGIITQTSLEPLLRSIVEMIMRDEARHVAFGILSLKDAYKEISSKELREREDFILEASRLMRDRLLMQEVWELMGMPVDECVKISLQSQAMNGFRALLFSKIVPNVKRLGLLTPYVRNGFNELGVLQYESGDPWQ